MLDKVYTISMKPVSINQMRKGRTFLTTIYKNFKSRAVSEILTQNPVLRRGKDLTLKVEFFCKELYRGDIDNSVKSVLDSCVEAGVFEDDRYITTLILKKTLADSDRVEITVYN